METDKHYFIEGLFIIGFAIAAALFFIWLAGSGHRDDVAYRMHFTESVSGLALGDAVKYHGVDVGSVKALSLDAVDPRRVQVDVALRKDAPIKADTRAMLKLKGITGSVFIELSGGSPESISLLSGVPPGEVPEIIVEKSSLNTFLDMLPTVLEKFSAIEDQTKKVMNNMGELTNKLKDNPSLLLWKPKDKPAAEKTSDKKADKKADRK